jgi:predicted transcriptional regulator
LEEVALETRHFALMRAIEAAENRSQQLLAERLQIPPSSMVALLDQLEQRGIVARHLDPSDRRVRVVAANLGLAPGVHPEPAAGGHPDGAPGVHGVHPDAAGGVHL